MKLEVGMYVRTDTGIIEKINQIYDRHATDNIVVWLNGYGDGRSVFVDDFEEVKYQSINARGFIKKEPSYNIIDLIEVGDYVNGCYVSNKRASANEHLGGNPKQIGIIKCNAYFNQGNYDDCNFKWIEAKDIKSIVTKEQFKANEYVIEK